MGKKEFKVQIKERSDSSAEYKRPELLQKAIEEIEAEVAAKEEQEQEQEDSSSEYDSDEEEDEDANLLTAAVDSQIFRTIAAIRNKDPRVYEQSTTFYEPTDDSKEPKKKKEKAIKLKDYERDILLNHGGVVDEKPKVPLTHAQEQEQLRNAFKLAADEDDKDSDDEGDDFLVEKQKTSEEKEAEESEYRQFLLEHMKDDEPSKKAFEEWNNYKNNPNINPDDAFLMDYVLNRGWVDKEGDKVNDEDVYKEEEYLDDVDRFESKYNFRFEEEGAGEIKTYARNIEGSVRRKESKRAKRRAREKAHKEALKEQKLLELKEHKNKKMKEIHEKLKELKGITGVNALGLENIDLDADFDPQAFDNQMNDVFNDEYYQNEDLNEKPTWDDDIMDADYLPDADQYEEEQPASEEQKKKLDALMDEYYSLNYEDVVGGDVYTRFKYVKTDPIDFGLTAEEILLADDKDLNKFVGIKSLAPYRNEKKLKSELKSFEKNKQYKMKELMKSVKKTKKQIEKEEEKAKKEAKKDKKRSKKSKRKSEDDDTNVKKRKKVSSK